MMPLGEAAINPVPRQNIEANVREAAAPLLDEVGIAALMPGGGHGIAGSFNLSNVELYAYPAAR